MFFIYGFIIAEKHKKDIRRNTYMNAFGISISTYFLREYEKSDVIHLLIFSN